VLIRLITTVLYYLALHECPLASPIEKNQMNLRPIEIKLIK